MAGEVLAIGLKEIVVVGPLGIGFIIITAFGCIWCRQKWQKFKEWRNQSAATIPSVLPSQGASEYAVSPSVSQPSPVSTTSGAILNEIVFEPLPEIRSRKLQAVAQSVRPAFFSGSGRRFSLQDWFDEHQGNFPRNQLKYLRELGCAWYGQAVEGEAYSILPNEEKTRVVVKILRVDAITVEYTQFLNEARPFRDLRNPFLLRLIGQCLEVHPFLLVMEHCEMDLKTCLIQQRKSPEVLLKDGLMLRMAFNVASAIQYMHEHGYIHGDVAAHSCVVTKDFIVKVGDYGTSIHTHKSDYYCLGDIAFPLRWCAPETLYCTESYVESRDLTKSANVWSFGIFLWELLEFGKLPYMDFADEEVVQKVIIESSVRLEHPKTPCVHKSILLRIMDNCWHPQQMRPSMDEIWALLCHMYENKDVLTESAVFEAKWNALQPELQSHCLVQHPSSSHLKFESDLKAKSDHSLAKDCDSLLSTDFSSPRSDKSPSRGSLSLGYEVGFMNEISPSLRNLRGSYEDLMASHVSVYEESDYDEKKNVLIEQTIAEAINDIDIVLASALTSSDSSESQSSDKVTDEHSEIAEAISPVKLVSKLTKIPGSMSPIKFIDDESIGDSFLEKSMDDSSNELETSRLKISDDKSFDINEATYTKKSFDGSSKMVEIPSYEKVIVESEKMVEANVDASVFNGKSTFKECNPEMQYALPSQPLQKNDADNDDFSGKISRIVDKQLTE